MTEDVTKAASPTLAERIRQIKIGETEVIDGRSYWRTGPNSVHSPHSNSSLDIDEAAARAQRI